MDVLTCWMFKNLSVILVIIASGAYAQVNSQTFGLGANQFSIDFVEIGNPNNSNDSNGYGSVGYGYKIGKYEISQGQIDAASANGLVGMEIPASPYSASQPAAYLNWFQSAAFVNWLNTSSGFQAAYNLAWDGSRYSMNLWDSQSAWSNGGVNLFRNKDAHYFITSENEWYKAAYYNPSTSTYSLYPTKGDIAPSQTLSGNSSGTAVYSPNPSLLQILDPSAIEMAGGESYYGTVGQGGNLVERLETAADRNNDNANENRVARGGSFFQETNLLESTTSEDHTPESQYWSLGFRISSVPEPSAVSLLAIGLGGLAMIRRRRS